jgi:DNA-binding SARP family transcriptional activator
VALIEHPRPALKLTLLGGFEARADSGSVLRFRTTKTQALVAYLALESHAQHLRTKLAALLWGGARDEQARDSLRHALHDMRSVLRVATPRALVICGDTVALDPANIDVDVTRFEHLIGSGSLCAVRQAIEIYRGDLLDGIVVDEELFERWLAQRREHLRARALGALEKQLEAHVTNQRVEQAIEAAHRLLAFDPAHEAVHRTLMNLYIEQGTQGGVAPVPIVRRFTAARARNRPRAGDAEAVRRDSPPGTCSIRNSRDARRAKFADRLAHSRCGFVEAAGAL